MFEILEHLPYVCMKFFMRFGNLLPLLFKKVDLTIKHKPRSACSPEPVHGISVLI